MDGRFCLFLSYLYAKNIRAVPTIYIIFLFRRLTGEVCSSWDIKVSHYNLRQFQDWWGGGGGICHAILQQVCFKKTLNTRTKMCLCPKEFGQIDCQVWLGKKQHLVLESKGDFETNRPPFDFPSQKFNQDYLFSPLRM